MKRRGLGKKGDEKYYIIISLILGLMFLGLALYFIFNEYFNQEEIDLETCRQSVVLRNNMPDIEAKVTTFQIKDKFPLKCKNEVIVINYKDVSKAEKQIADSILQCWNLFGNGNFGIFPSASWSSGSYCMVCSRISISSDPKILAYYQENPIDIHRGLSKSFDGTQTYFDYLEREGKNAFSLVEDFKSPSFRIHGGKHKREINGQTFEAVTFDLPRYFDPSKGNLFIFYQTVVFNINTKSTNLFYSQEKAQIRGEGDEGFTTVSLWEAVKSKSDAFMYSGWTNRRAATCESWENIPA